MICCQGFQHGPEGLTSIPQKSWRRTPHSDDALCCVGYTQSFTRLWQNRKNKYWGRDPARGYKGDARNHISCWQGPWAQKYICSAWAPAEVVCVGCDRLCSHTASVAGAPLSIQKDTSSCRTVQKIRPVGQGALSHKADNYIHIADERLALAVHRYHGRTPLAAPAGRLHSGPFYALRVGNNQNSCAAQLSARRGRGSSHWVVIQQPATVDVPYTYPTTVSRLGRVWLQGHILVLVRSTSPKAMMRIQSHWSPDQGADVSCSRPDADAQTRRASFGSVLLTHRRHPRLLNQPCHRFRHTSIQSLPTCWSPVNLKVHFLDGHH
jgi:hypothetical protein